MIAGLAVPQGRGGFQRVQAMRVCVITPYDTVESQWLREAHESVRAQSVPAEHVLVCDGVPPASFPALRGTHVVLRNGYRDSGNTARLIGCYEAVQQGADAIAFLDADSWYYQTHLAGMLTHAEANGLDACCSGRMLHRLDGRPLMPCPVVDGQRHVDTSCLLVMKAAFRHMLCWTLLPRDVAGMADQFLWQRMAEAGAKLGFVPRMTVAHRTRGSVG